MAILLKAAYSFMKSIITGTPYQSIYDPTLSNNSYIPNNDLPVGNGVGKRKYYWVRIC